MSLTIGKIIKISKKQLMKVFKNFFFSLKNYSNFQKLNNLENSIIFYVENKRDWDHLEVFILS